MTHINELATEARPLAKPQTSRRGTYIHAVVPIINHTLVNMIKKNGCKK